MLVKMDLFNTPVFDKQEAREGVFDAIGRWTFLLLLFFFFFFNIGVFVISW